MARAERDATRPEGRFSTGAIGDRGIVERLVGGKSGGGWEISWSV